MNGTGRVKLEGKDDIKAIVKRIPYTLYGKLGQVVKAALRPYAREMKRLVRANRRSGFLEKSIKSKVTAYQHNTVYYGIVGPDRDISGQYKGKTVRPANYAHLLDGGTAPHFLSKRDTGVREVYLVIPKKGNRKPYYRSRKVFDRFGRKHPGAKPHPFAGPAFAAGRAASIAAGNAELDKVLAEAMGPLNPKKAA